MVDTAFITQVPFGSLTVEGLMDNTGKYYVGVPQLSMLMPESFATRHQSRDIKRILGKDSSFAQFKTELNEKEIEYNILRKVGYTHEDALKLL